MKKKLNPKQELFCKLYATDRDCFGNGVQAYLKVYDTNKKKPISYKSAKTQAYLLLTNLDLCSRIRELIDIHISDEVVDKELGQVILQYGDLPSKVAAVREYNKVKGRLAPTAIKFIDPNADEDDELLTDEERGLVEAVRKRKEKSKIKKKAESS